MSEIIVLDQENCLQCWNTMSICGSQAHPLSIHVNVNGAACAGVSLAFEPCQAEPCLSACPVHALKRDHETGMVVWQEEACIGCRLCVRACPYGAIKISKK